MRRPIILAPLLMLALLSACHAQARAPASLSAAAQGADAALLASCGDLATLSHALAAELGLGRAPEASPMGQCVANAARMGSIRAAMLLANTYRQAMVAAAGASGGSAALGLDVFGRHIGWLHMAADRGDPAAQLLLAQETDGPASIAMPDLTLTWYQTAAENGNRPALAAIGTAYRQGRIAYDRLYDFRNWLAARPNPAPAYRQMASLLTSQRTINRR